LRAAWRRISPIDGSAKLFATIAPRYVIGPRLSAWRPGYGAVTRRGAGGRVAGANTTLRPGRTAKAVEKPKKTVGGRIRAALGGGRKKDDDSAVKSKASKPARGAGKKVTTPRKAGGA
jgi:hypothetical protein